MTLADIDRDDLDDLADWLEDRRKRRTERAAQADLHEKIDALAGRGLSDEDVDRIARRVTQLANDGGDDPGADGQGAGNGGGSGGGRRSADPDPKPTPKKKRPGRKSGQVYDFDVDDNGRPVPLDVAKVYVGDDEPDTVEYDDEDGDDAA